jgi:hypothetical protein
VLTVACIQQPLYKIIIQRIYYWFFNHTRSTSSGTGRKDLLRLTANSRKLQPVQAYSRLYYDTKVKDTVNARYKEYIETTAKPEQLSRIVFAANITKEFFEAETEEVKQEVDIYRERLFSGGTIKLDGTSDGNDIIDEEAQQLMNKNMQL